jgi:hypothetical protein
MAPVGMAVQTGAGSTAAVELTVAGTAGPPGAVPLGAGVARRGAAARTAALGERLAAMGWLVGAAVGQAARLRYNKILCLIIVGRLSIYFYIL